MQIYFNFLSDGIVPVLSALSSMLFLPCQVGFTRSSSPLTPYNIYMTLSDGTSEAGGPGGAFRSARSCYAIFAAFHVLCYELWGICGITSRCMACGGVIKTRVFFDLSNKSLLSLLPHRRHFSFFQDQPVELLNLTQVNFSRLKYTSKKEEHALQGSVRIKSYNLGATLTSEFIRSKVGTHLRERLQRNVV